MLIWVQFIGCTALILFSGAKLSKYGDVIAEKTGLGRTWIGVVLIASVTSLPELITGLSSVALFDLPNIAAGDVLGSCMFNLLIIALLDLFHGPTPVSARAHEGQVLTAGFGMALLGLVCLSIAAGAKLPAIGWIGISSPIFILFYLAAMRTVFLYEQKRIAKFIEEQAESAGYEQISKARAWAMYGLNAAVIVGAATWLPHLGDRIAEMTGLGRTFVGSIFIALSTSLPELVVSLAALRLGAVDMVYGNILGSNLFNIGILALDDVAYTKGPLLAQITGSHLITASAAIVMTAMAVIGLIYRRGKKVFYLGGDSLGILLVYVFATWVLYALR
jgi:cation:H+ antiporter